MAYKYSKKEKRQMILSFLLSTGIICASLIWIIPSLQKELEANPDPTIGYIMNNDFAVTSTTFLSNIPYIVPILQISIVILTLLICYSLFKKASRKNTQKED